MARVDRALLTLFIAGSVFAVSDVVHTLVTGQRLSHFTVAFLAGVGVGVAIVAIGAAVLGVLFLVLRFRSRALEARVVAAERAMGLADGAERVHEAARGA